MNYKTLLYPVTMLLQNMNTLLGAVINKSNVQLQQLSQLRCELKSLREGLANLDDSVRKLNNSLKEQLSGHLLQTANEIAQLQNSLNISMTNTASRLANEINTSFIDTQSFLAQQLHTLSTTVCSKLENQTDTVLDVKHGTDSKNASSSVNQSDNCGGPGWRRVAYLDMTDPNTTCPSGWRLTDYSKRTCGRVYTQRYTCNPVIFPVSAKEYSSVCGRIKAYQYGATEAFSSGTSNIDLAYFSGVSVTHGYPRKHIWSFAAGRSDLETGTEACPCEANRNLSVPFIGNDYFCESGRHQRWGQRWTPDYILYTDDPLWDGKNCLRGICCEFNNPPYFIKKLPMPSTEYIEVRICSRQLSNYEDIAIEEVELYVQ